MTAFLNTATQLQQIVANSSNIEKLRIVNDFNGRTA